MSERITTSDLEAVVRRINRTVNGTDQVELWTRTDEGLKANVGVFYLDGAYGGVDLYRMVNESGGVDDVFRCGHIPKRELYALMQALLRGYEMYADERTGMMTPEDIAYRGNKGI